MLVTISGEWYQTIETHHLSKKPRRGKHYPSIGKALPQNTFSIDIFGFSPIVQRFVNGTYGDKCGEANISTVIINSEMAYIKCKRRHSTEELMLLLTIQRNNLWWGTLFSDIHGHVTVSCEMKTQQIPLLTYIR